MLDWLLWLICFLAGPSSPTQIPLLPAGPSLCLAVSGLFPACALLTALAVLLPWNSHSGSRTKPHHNPCTSISVLANSSLLWLDLLLYSLPLADAHSFNSPNFSSFTAISIFQIPVASSPFLCWTDLDESYVFNSYFLKETFWLLSNHCVLIKIWKQFRFSNLVSAHLWARQSKVFFLLLTNSNRVSSFSGV